MLQIDQQVEREGFVEKWMQFNCHASKYILDILADVEFPLELGSTPTISSILKAYNVSVTTDHVSLLDKIIDYITIVAELRLCKILVFIGLHTVLNENELLELYKHARYQCISLFDIEAADKGLRLPSEKTVIIDKDSCEILLNYDMM